MSKVLKKMGVLKICVFAIPKFLEPNSKYTKRTKNDKSDINNVKKDESTNNTSRI
jgi:hypothetical protein